MESGDAYFIASQSRITLRSIQATRYFETVGQDKA